jgi:hypothetical protein
MTNEEIKTLADGYYAGNADWLDKEQEQDTKVGWMQGFAYALRQFAVSGWASSNLKIMYQFEKQFRLENPQTIGETDSHFDLDNYKDWLEQKLIASNVALNDLVFQVKQYASGDIGTMDYFREELKVAEKAFVPLG